MGDAPVVTNTEEKQGSDALLIRTFLPLIPWFIIKVGGFPVSSHGAVSQCFVPPPSNVSRELARGFSPFSSDALRSPSYRREVRRLAMRRLAPVCEEIRPWSQALLAELLPERERQYDPSCIRKLVETEAEIKDWFDQAALELVRTLPEDSPLIFESRRQDELTLLLELALTGQASGRPKVIRRDSAIWSILGIDPNEFQSLSPQEGASLAIRQFFGILGIGAEGPDETRLKKLKAWMLERHLPPEEPTETTGHALREATRAGLVHPVRTTCDKRTGEPIGEVEVDDGCDSARFIRQVEDSDELDRIVSRAKLSPGEQLVLMGMRNGFKGEELQKWVEARGQGIKSSSVPVLATRVRSKLRSIVKD